jgi:phosphoribosylaminoimidazole-succinocarboxamide synthase
MDLKREQLKNKIALLLKDFLREVYNKPRSSHYSLPYKYSEIIVKILEEYNETSKKSN